MGEPPLDHPQKLPGNQALELAEGLLLKDLPDLSFLFGAALAEDQFANVAEQGKGLFR